MLVEKDPRVADLWRRLLTMSPTEVLALVPPAAGEWTEDFLWMTVASSNSTARARGNTMSARSAAIAEGMLRRIARVLPFVQGKIIIVEGEYWEAPEMEATWFIDPPYQPAGSHALSRGRGYAVGCDSGSLDYEALAAFCRTRRGHVIVCECEGADWLPFGPKHATWTSKGTRRTELVWEYPPPRLAAVLSRATG